METLRKFFNHERYQAIAVLLICGLLIWFYGCDSKVASLTRANVQVNRGELELEIQTLQGLVELRYQNLKRQDMLKQTLINQALVIGATGTLNPIGLMTALAALLGTGATIDNVRKRKEIKTLTSG